METMSLKIEGMSCGHCTRAVSRALHGLDGVLVETVEIGSATLRYDPARIGPKQIVRVIDGEGFSALEQITKL